MLLAPAIVDLILLGFRGFTVACFAVAGVFSAVFCHGALLERDASDNSGKAVLCTLMAVLLVCALLFFLVAPFSRREYSLPVKSFAVTEALTAFFFGKNIFHNENKKAMKIYYSSFNAKTNMRIVMTLIMMTSIITAGCNGGQRSADEAQADPAATAETIFYLIQNEEYDALPALIGEEADDNSKQLGELKDAGKEKQQQTKEYFASASLNRDPVIDGDKATVKIKLGYEGRFEETFGMVKKNGKWYLSSY